MQRNSQPIDWRIKGACDAQDGSMAFPGAMLALSNLIPDLKTKNVWVCRPASMKLVDFNAGGGEFSSEFSSEFSVAYIPGSTLGTISVMRLSGSVLYGMIGVTAGPLAGHDVPFAYNLSTNTAITVTGSQTTNTTPVSQPTAGPWVPPQMDLIGIKMMVAHPGFSGAGGNYVGWFDLTNPLAPVWNAGNLTGGAVSFTVPPIAVKQFFNRAYYIHNATNSPAVIFSDALNPTNVGFATQVLTFGDNTPLTALGQWSLTNVLGGIVQTIMVFKGVQNIFQITGDAALNNLFVNTLNYATGTLAPNSVCPSPKGLWFLAPDGFRLIDLQGQVTDPIGIQGTGISVPFIRAAQPTRVFACCNGILMRVYTQNADIGTVPNQDWWFDLVRGCWSGPHTFPAALAVQYQQTFIIAPAAVASSLWQSDFTQGVGATFIENGAQMAWTYQTVLLPDAEQITNNCITEGSVDLALPPGGPAVSVAFLNQAGASISQVSIPSPPSVGGAVWGQSIWGQFYWGGGGPSNLAPYQLDWPIAIVFARGTLLASSQSALGLKVSTIHLRIQMLRAYVNTSFAA